MHTDSDDAGNEFQSTPSAWRETNGGKAPVILDVFQSTPSAWRETNFLAVASPNNRISIHSLRMEGDSINVVIFRLSQISIHSLRMEGDL